jgi:hypothetical protein
MSLLFGAISLGFLAYMKYLKSTNEEQKENIDRLKKEIEIRSVVAKDEQKRKVFEAKQKVRLEELKKSEITLDEIEKEIQQNEKKNHTGNNNDDSFVTMRV